ncbi:MAG TPA: IS1 family transposase [Candidatus Acidoferrales bacterium]|nr:IS1 family transposase [Candidatus Acidoferrales bacterium]
MPNPETDYRLATAERQAEMNVLSKDKQAQILNALVEGCSVRATARLVGVEHKTVLRVLLRTGKRCAQLLDEKMRGIRARRVQVDEMHSFVYVRQKNLNPSRHDDLTMGEQYLFIAMDSETKLVPSFLIGKRDARNAYFLMKDLESRLATRPQLTTDGFRPYVNAVDDTFGTQVDYAMLIKMYSGDESTRERYSPSEIVETRTVPVMGNPKPQYISTSHIERQNLTVRMQLRRFTRLTNAFSKKLENLKAALALYFAWYNFCRIHSTLRVTPAMAAGISSHVWSLGEIL